MQLAPDVVRIDIVADIEEPASSHGVGALDLDPVKQSPMAGVRCMVTEASRGCPEGGSSLQKPTYRMAPPARMSPPAELKPVSTRFAGRMKRPLVGISSGNVHIIHAKNKIAGRIIMFLAWTG